MRRRRIFFVFLILPLLLGPAYSYLGWRLGMGARGWELVAIPFLCVLIFPFLVLRRGTQREPSRGESALSLLAYWNMGLVSFLLVAFLMRDLLGVVAGRWVSVWMALGAAVLMLATGITSGAFGPFVRKVKVPLAPALKGLRIVQLSDLHLSTNISLAYVRRVVRKVRALEPDLVVLTGDIGDGHVSKLRPEIEELKNLGAPVYFATGNHEVYWNFEEWMKEFRSLGWKVLLNRGERASVRGHDVFVAGITDPQCEMVGLPPDLAAASRGGEGAALRVLLSHRPDPAEAASAAGFDLQLSGHTHGGQFVPWTIVAGLVHKYSLGLYRVGKMFIYVSAGTGSWGPRIRLGTTAEVTLLELTGESN